MTKKKRLFFVTGILLVVAAILFLYWFYQPRSLHFADSVTIRSTKEGADWEVAVTDKEDIQRLISICSQNEPYPLDAAPGPLYGVESFRCPFDYELTFSGRGKSVRVRPASDSCDPIIINGEIRSLTNHGETKKELNEIIGRYTNNMTA